MPEEGQAEPKLCTISSRRPLVLLMLKGVAKVFEPAAFQVILAGEVKVERRSSDLGQPADIGDGRGLVTLVQDEGDQRILQNLPCAGNTAVDPWRDPSRHLFSDTSRSLFNIRHSDLRRR